MENSKPETKIGRRLRHFRTRMLHGAVWQLHLATHLAMPVMAWFKGDAKAAQVYFARAHIIGSVDIRRVSTQAVRQMLAKTDLRRAA